MMEFNVAKGHIMEMIKKNDQTNNTDHDKIFTVSYRERNLGIISFEEGASVLVKGS